MNNLSFKIPIWAILTGGGSIDLYLNDPKISFIKRKKESNWDRSMGPSEKKPPVKDKRKGQKKSEQRKSAERNSKTDLPSFVKKSKINFKINSVAYLQTI